MSSDCMNRYNAKTLIGSSVLAHNSQKGNAIDKISRVRTKIPAMMDSVEDYDIPK